MSPDEIFPFVERALVDPDANYRAEIVAARHTLGFGLDVIVPAEADNDLGGTKYLCIDNREEAVAFLQRVIDVLRRSP